MRFLIPVCVMLLPNLYAQNQQLENLNYTLDRYEVSIQKLINLSVEFDSTTDYESIDERDDNFIKLKNKFSKIRGTYKMEFNDVFDIYPEDLSLSERTIIYNRFKTLETGENKAIRLYQEKLKTLLEKLFGKNQPVRKDILMTTRYKLKYIYDQLSRTLNKK